jgi:uncharacterized membrane protein
MTGNPSKSAAKFCTTKLQPPLFLQQIFPDMKFPFFAITVLLTIFCFMMMIKSFDYGQGWAIALSVVGVLTFAVLSIISLLYQMRQHETMGGHQHDHH